MPEIPDVNWTKTPLDLPTANPRAPKMTEIAGEWEGYMCRIIPIYWKNGMYHANVTGSAGKECPALSRVNYICRLASISFAGSPPRPGRVAGRRWCGSWGRQTPG